MKDTHTTALWENFLRIVKSEVKPALGCTEPVSLALAAATAAAHLPGKVQKVEAWVSPNLMKNGMGVTMPGSGMTGLPVAAALGALCGEAKAGLEVLKNVTPPNVDAACRMIAQKQVRVSIDHDCTEVLYARVRVWQGEHHATVTIAGEHTNIINIAQDDIVVFRGDNSAPQSSTLNLPDVFRPVTLSDILLFAEKAAFSDLEFILDAAELNDALSQEGLHNEWGLHVGATLARQSRQGIIGTGLLSDILTRTAAASDARMGGAPLPAMSNSGSGNQGIAATLPVVVVAEHVVADQEQLARALILSHLTAVYIHSKLPTLSALCAASTASMGAAAGMAWLLGGNLNTISMAVNSMIGDVSGIICDGASNSCAMKVSTGAASAFKAVLMALDGTAVTGREGIVCDEVEHSLNNLCALACHAMQYSDRQIIAMMVQKAI
ncbi:MULTISPECIES: serine dehydratase subunit alpha family protein [Enterobacterales]|uniref:L-cysteine desulfidase family protein n=1 Tax=Enterobacterales TaxID=91347 RepID=UPI002ED7E549